MGWHPGHGVRAGLADELARDPAPVFLGRARRFLGSSIDEIVLDDPHVIVAAHRVLHLRYRLRRCSPVIRGHPRRHLADICGR